jgi:Zn-dependent protease with chaperone function
MVFCPHCRWLRPLAPDYHMPVETFMWSLDAQAMGVLRSIGPLNAAAQGLSDRVGRPWLESSVNGIRLGPDQLPEIFDKAVLAARIVGLPVMPEIYISGEAMWDASTLGSDTSAFVVIGSVLTNLQGDDLLYVLGREMGHCAAGHALWKTVMQFMSGKKTMNQTIMGQGVLQFLNPSKIVESAIDAPLMAWARHAEITADRAGSLVVGKKDVVRRVQTQWAVRSFPIYQRLNLDALERQVNEADDGATQLAEWTMTTTPYLARRLRMTNEFFATESFQAWRKVIEHWTAPPPEPPKPLPPPVEDGMVRLSCIMCGEPLRFPKTLFEGKAAIKVRCANNGCGKVMEVSPKPPSQAKVERIASEARDTIRLQCAACAEPLRVPKSAFVEGKEVLVRCPNAACRQVLTVTPPPPEKLPTDQLVDP